MLQHDEQLLRSTSLGAITEDDPGRRRSDYARALGLRRHVSALAQLGVRVSVVIAAMNEAENLPYVFARLPAGLHEVIVVDGHSVRPDRCGRAEPTCGCVIVAQTGRGKGNALAEGFAVCTGEIVVALDADGSTDAAEIPRFVAALCNGADFVKGSRFAQGGASTDITAFAAWGTAS